MGYIYSDFWCYVCCCCCFCVGDRYAVFVANILSLVAATVFSYTLWSEFVGGQLPHTAASIAIGLWNGLYAMILVFVFVSALLRKQRLVSISAYTLCAHLVLNVVAFLWFTFGHSGGMVAAIIVCTILVLVLEAFNAVVVFGYAARLKDEDAPREVSRRSTSDLSLSTQEWGLYAAQEEHPIEIHPRRSYARVPPMEPQPDRVEEYRGSHPVRVSREEGRQSRDSVLRDSLENRVIRESRVVEGREGSVISNTETLPPYSLHDAGRPHAIRNSK